MIQLFPGSRIRGAVLWLSGWTDRYRQLVDDTMTDGRRGRESCPRPGSRCCYPAANSPRRGPDHANTDCVSTQMMVDDCMCRTGWTPSPSRAHLTLQEVRVARARSGSARGVTHDLAAQRAGRRHGAKPTGDCGFGTCDSRRPEFACVRVLQHSTVIGIKILNERVPEVRAPGRRERASGHDVRSLRPADSGRLHRPRSIYDLNARAYIDNPDVEIVALVDPDPQRRAHRQADWPQARVFATAADLASSGLAVDAAEVLLPIPLHAEGVCEMLGYGWHLNLQKPMCSDLSEAQQMLEAARVNDRVLRVMENYIFYEPLQRLKETVDSGVLGGVSGYHMKMVGSGRGGWDVPRSSFEWQFAQMRRGRGILVFDDGWHSSPRPCGFSAHFGRCGRGWARQRSFRISRWTRQPPSSGNT